MMISNNKNLKKDNTITYYVEMILIVEAEQSLALMSKSSVKYRNRGHTDIIKEMKVLKACDGRTLLLNSF